MLNTSNAAKAGVVTPEQIQQIAEICKTAAKFAKTSAEVAGAKEVLSQAYVCWKREQRVDYFIERGSGEWDQMLDGTSQEYRQLLNAKQRHRYAAQKLIKAVGG